MKTIDVISDNKLRGGFYSPAKLVDLAILRALSLNKRVGLLKILEPSCGDGAFIDGFSRIPNSDDIEIYGVEIAKDEAAKAAMKLTSKKITGKIISESFFNVYDKIGDFDIVVGNPPYVRYQFISDMDKIRIDEIAHKSYISISGVANVWIPIVVSALSKLKVGGSFAFIIPNESLAGVSAQQFRKWIVANFSNIKIDVFPPGAFQGVLQETLVISGTRALGNQVIEFVQHYVDQPESTWSHRITNHDTWYRYLLNEKELSLYEGASKISKPMKSIAKFDVSIVTGANDYFCIDSITLEGFELQEWGEPLLARSRMADGIVYTHSDYLSSAQRGNKVFILNFSSNRSSPLEHEKSAEYVKIGEEFNLHQRYKCSIREPWYRIPNMVHGELMLSKRCHFSPRVIANEAGVLTTDTIYRGNIIKGVELTPQDLTTTFHNSLTLLSAELEGRSFGGGVLELVPSEVSRLRVVAIKGASQHIYKMDRAFRSCKTEDDFQSAIDSTHSILSHYRIGLLNSDYDDLNTALVKMRQRRLDRN